MGHHKKPTKSFHKSSETRKKRRYELRKASDRNKDIHYPNRKEYKDYQSPEIIQKMKRKKTKNRGI